jgi:hypothetical protein
MAEFHMADASLRRFNAAMTIMVCAAVVALAYWYERGYRRWAEQQHPFTAPRARLTRARTTYRDRRALMTELARAIRG